MKTSLPRSSGRVPFCLADPLRAGRNSKRLAFSGLTLAGLLLVSSTSACRNFFPRPPEEIGLWSDAGGRTSDAGLRELVVKSWDAYLAAHPEYASQIGDPRFLNRLDDNSRAGMDARRKQLWDFQLDLDQIPIAVLNTADRRTAQLLGAEFENELSSLDLDLEAWTVDPLDGPQVRFANLIEEQPTATPRERDRYLQRLEEVAPYLRRLGEAHLKARSEGKLAPSAAILKAVAQIDRMLSTAPLLSPYVAPAIAGGRMLALGPKETLAGLAAREYGSSERAELLRTVNPHVLDGEVRSLGTYVLLPSSDDPLAPGKRGALLGRAREIVAEQIYPAFANYRAVLHDELLPVARSDDKPGLVWMPGGREAYSKLAKLHVGQAVDVTAVHLDGLTAVDRIHAEILALGQEIFGARGQRELRVALAQTPGLNFENAEEILSSASAALTRAEQAYGKFLTNVPAARCSVVAIPAVEAPESTIAYYREPSPELLRPGRYFVNTYQPSTRPRWQSEVLTFHESVPGHHTQVALAQQLHDLPAFRRYLGSTAFVEGWALYTERLADELGLYSGPTDRLGMLSFDAWRAARLVVDTGLHSEGWTRAQAVAYLRDFTLLTEENIQNEVDRYIVWPGQALAYKLGADEIVALRRLAELRLGDRFDLPAFHSELLRHGAVSLPVLREIMTEWIAASAS